MPTTIVSTIAAATSAATTAEASATTKRETLGVDAPHLAATTAPCCDAATACALTSAKTNGVATAWL